MIAPWATRLRTHRSWNGKIGARALRASCPRQAADVTTAAELKQSRGRVWRYPAGTRGRRHADKAQEEVFVVISGALTMLLGRSAGTASTSGRKASSLSSPARRSQVRNEGSEELVLYIYGAPPEQEGADFFDDPGDLLARGLLPDADELLAHARERLALPAAPPFAWRHARDPRHQVQLRRPHVAERPRRIRRIARRRRACSGARSGPGSRRRTCRTRGASRLTAERADRLTERQAPQRPAA